MNTIERAMEQRGRNAEVVPVPPESASPVDASREVVAPAAKRVDPDWARLRRLGLLTPTSGESELNEYYRFIKRPLLNTAFGGESVNNLIMVTSAIPGEGKTFTSINLAVSIARELDSTVLLVDADVTNRATSRLLGVSDQPGLMDVLAGDAYGVGDVILSTGMDRLRIIPAGKRNPGINTDELLASRRMRDLVEELARRYPDRVVLFDAPPLLATSQASNLAERMSQVVMVVAAGRTLQSQVLDAVEAIKPGPHVGLVLNMTGERSASDGYGRPYK